MAVALHICVIGLLFACYVHAQDPTVEKACRTVTSERACQAPCTWNVKCDLVCTSIDDEKGCETSGCHWDGRKCAMKLNCKAHTDQPTCQAAHCRWDEKVRACSDVQTFGSGTPMPVVSPTRQSKCTPLVERECAANIACSWDTSASECKDSACLAIADQRACAGNTACSWDARMEACVQSAPQTPVPTQTLGNKCTALEDEKVCAAVPSCQWNPTSKACVESLPQCSAHKDEKACVYGRCQWDGRVCGPIATPLPTQTINSKCTPLTNERTCASHTACSWDATAQKCMDAEKPTDAPRPVPTHELDDKCAPLKDEKMCSAIRTCTWDERTKECNGYKPQTEPPMESKCKALGDERQCTAVAVCQWNAKEEACVDASEHPCDPIADEKHCSEKAACQWIETDQACVVKARPTEPPMSACAPLKDEKRCAATKGCQWDAKVEACSDAHESTSSPVINKDVCSAITVEDRCKSLQNCAWSADAKQCIVTRGSDPQPHERSQCGNQTAEDACRAAKCTWNNGVCSPAAISTPPPVTRPPTPTRPPVPTQPPQCEELGSPQRCEYYGCSWNDERKACGKKDLRSCADFKADECPNIVCSVMNNKCTSVIRTADNSEKSSPVALPGVCNQLVASVATAKVTSDIRPDGRIPASHIIRAKSAVEYEACGRDYSYLFTASWRIMKGAKCLEKVQSGSGESVTLRPGTLRPDSYCLFFSAAARGLDSVATSLNFTIVEPLPVVEIRGGDRTAKADLVTMTAGVTNIDGNPDTAKIMWSCCIHAQSEVDECRACPAPLNTIAEQKSLGWKLTNVPAGKYDVKFAYGGNAVDGATITVIKTTVASPIVAVVARDRTPPSDADTLVYAAVTFRGRYTVQWFINGTRTDGNGMSLKIPKNSLPADALTKVSARAIPSGEGGDAGEGAITLRPRPPLPKGTCRVVRVDNVTDVIATVTRLRIVAEGFGDGTTFLFGYMAGQHARMLSSFTQRNADLEFKAPYLPGNPEKESCRFFVKVGLGDNSNAGEAQCAIDVHRIQKTVRDVVKDILQETDMGALKNDTAQVMKAAQNAVNALKDIASDDKETKRNATRDIIEALHQTVKGSGGDEDMSRTRRDNIVTILDDITEGERPSGETEQKVEDLVDKVLEASDAPEDEGFDAKGKGKALLTVLTRLDAGKKRVRDAFEKLQRKFAQQQDIGERATIQTPDVTITAERHLLANVANVTIGSTDGTRMRLPDNFDDQLVRDLTQNNVADDTSSVSVSGAEHKQNPVGNAGAEGETIGNVAEFDVSVDGRPHTVRNLTKPITIVIRAPRQLNLTMRYVCMFWDKLQSKWSRDGVRLVTSRGNEITCETTHLSMFATFVSAAAPTGPTPTNSNGGDDGTPSSSGDSDSNTKWYIVAAVGGTVVLVLGAVIVKRVSGGGEGPMMMDEYAQPMAVGDQNACVVMKITDMDYELSQVHNRAQVYDEI